MIVSPEQLQDLRERLPSARKLNQNQRQEPEQKQAETEPEQNQCLTIRDKK